MYKQEIACVYQIINTKNGDRYIGSTKNLSHRRAQHLYDLRHNANRIPKLQDAYNKFGEEALVFSVVEPIYDTTKLTEREQEWVNWYKPEYNTMLEDVTALPHDHVKLIEVKEKISNSVKELWKDPIYREKHHAPRNWKNGVPNRKGTKLTEEQKQHLSEINMGENNPNYGKNRSAETRQKMSDAIGDCRTYSGLVSPDGTIYAPINNMSAKFCRRT